MGRVAPSTARLTRPARPARPPANPAYADPHYRRARARLLAPGPICAHGCGRPATEADHQPPLSRHPHLLGGACTCTLVPSCAPCARRQGRLLAVIAGAVRRGTVTVRPAPAAAPAAPAPATTAVELDAVGYDVDDAVWDAAPWLEDLRDVPDMATWPRLMTPPHPSAVGSYGAELAAHAERSRRVELRWWQRLSWARILEHDDAGYLCWDEAALTVARQVGKSTGLRESAMWRLDTGGDRWGEPQLILHTGKDLAVCVEVQRPARRWAAELEDIYKVRQANGQETIERLADGSRWLVRAKDAAFSLSASQALVDEAWKVEADLIEEGVVPTMVERVSPQLLLVSTAHRKATGLMVNRRNTVIDDVAATDGTLWLEWSASPLLADHDETGWRQASPHWSPARRKLIARRYAAAVAGEATDDPDEGDPLESFRTQWLNRWPRRHRRRGRGEPVIDRDLWAACTGRLAGDLVAVVVAINDNYGNGGAVAVAAIDAAGAVEVDGRLCESRDDAFAGAARFARQYPTARIVVGVTLRQHVPVDFPRRYNVRAVGAQEAQTALPLLRDLAARRRILHHNSGPLDDQLHTARVYPLTGGGLAFVNNGARLDLLKAALWAVAGVAAPKPQPAIH